jgi:hypothetical protein
MKMKQLTVRGALADLSLAALSSVVTVLGTVAFAAMVFSGSLANVVPLAFLAFLTGTALCGLLIALFSRFYCNLSGAQDEPAAILATFAGGLASMGVIHDARQSRRCSPSLFSPQPASEWSFCSLVSLSGEGTPNLSPTR